jgi:peptidoglycan hydrolase CwlO-like protein
MTDGWPSLMPMTDNASRRWTTTRGRGARSAFAALFLVTAVAAGSLPRTSRAQTDDSLERAQNNAAATEQSLDALVERYREVRLELTETGAELARAELAVRDVARRLLKEKKAARKMALELYKTGGAADLEALLSSASLADVNDTITYLGYAQRSRTEVFERMVVDEKLLRSRLADLEAQFDRERAALEELADIRERVEAELLRRQERVAEIENDIARREAEERVAEAEAAETEIASVPPPPPTPSESEPNTEWHADWDAIAECESGGNWHLDSTYDGGLQFHPDTWLAFGGGQYAPYAWQASRLQQIAIAEKVLASHGPGAWPNCFVSL